MIDHPGPAAWATLDTWGECRDIFIQPNPDLAAAPAGPGGRAPVDGQDKKDKPTPAQQAEISALMAAVDDADGGQAGTSTLPLEWAHSHFIKAQGDKTYVPFTLTIDPPAFTASTPVGVYILRVAKHGDTARCRRPPPAETKEGRRPPRAAPSARVIRSTTASSSTAAPAAPGQPQRIRRAFAVEPGDYDVFIAVNARKAAAAASTPPGRRLRCASHRATSGAAPCRRCRA